MYNIVISQFILVEVTFWKRKTIGTENREVFARVWDERAWGLTMKGHKGMMEMFCTLIGDVNMIAPFIRIHKIVHLMMNFTVHKLYLNLIFKK